MGCDHGGSGPTAGLFLGSPASHTSTQDDVTANQVSVLVDDDVGGFFEVTAVGMSRDEVLAVADGVQRGGSIADVKANRLNPTGSMSAWVVEMVEHEIGARWVGATS